MRHGQSQSQCFPDVVYLLALLETESLSRLVADLSWSPVLDRTWVDIAGMLLPLLAVSSKLLERLAVKLNEGFTDHRLHLAVALLHIEHHRDGHSASLPLVGGCCGILDDCHVSGLASSDELRSAHAKAIAVVGVKVGRCCAAAFVTEEVMLGCKLAYILTLGLHLLQLLGYHLTQELLCLNEADLYISVRVTLACQLLCESTRQALEYLCIGCGKLAVEPLDAVCGSVGGVLLGCEKVIELCYQLLDRGDKLDEALWNQHDTKVVAVLGAVGYGLSNIVDDILQGLTLLLYFLRDDANIGLGLECALQSDMACRTAHEFDEVPVLLGAVGVTLDVADQFAIGLAGGVKSEAGLYLVILEIAIDGLRTADDLNAGLVGEIVFCENTGRPLRNWPND